MSSEKCNVTVLKGTPRQLLKEYYLRIPSSASTVLKVPT